MTRTTGFLLLGSLLTACSPSVPIDDVFFVRSNGADMPVWVRGNPSSGVAIVFIAGGPGGPAMYLEEFRAFRLLEEKAVVAYWDQRLAGGTSGEVSSESLTLAQYATDLDGVVQVMAERYGLPRIILLGHSWGGLVGLAYLSSPNRQDRIAGWIDVDGVHDFARALALEREWAMQALQELIAAGSDVEHHLAQLAWLEEHPNIGCSEIRGTFLDILAELDPWPSNAASAGIGSAWLNLFSPFSGMSALLNLSRVEAEMSMDGSALCTALYTDLTSALADVTIPSLVIWGRQDLVPVALGEEAYASLGSPSEQKSLVVLESSGHNCFMDEPDAFALAIESFMTSSAP
jgi:pimeloyl-ACP methyl ester carboxylesterase